MNVDFTPDQQALVQQAIAAGRLHHENEAVKQALMLWEERERLRLEILAAIELSRAELARGEAAPGSVKILAPELTIFPAGNYVILYSSEKEALVQIHYVFHGNQEIESFFRR